ncbi:MAG: zf-HC2 domain-containing protein [Candidatus Omnitrophota bacterium]
MIQCKKVQELLKADYLDQEAGRQEEQLVKDHLKQCLACSELEQKLQAQRALFQGVKRQPVPGRIWGNIYDAIIAERLRQQEGLIPGLLERLRGLVLVRKPALVLATSIFTVIIMLAVFANVSIQRQVMLSKQNAAEGIAGYSLNAKNGYALYDLGTGIEEYFL